MRRPPPERIELGIDELKAILVRAALTPLGAEDIAKLQGAIETLAWLSSELERKRVSITRLRQLLFGASTEKTTAVLASHQHAPPAEPAPGSPPTQRPKPKGHGRHRAAEYTGAHTVVVAHQTLRCADPCPSCGAGKLYPLSEPRVLVRVRGQPPLHATVYQLERLRCHLCGELFRAKAPEGIGEHKYDHSAASMIALLKYGTGLPFNRLQRLHAHLGIPLPSTTQWEIVDEASKPLTPAYEELLGQAAQGELVHNDDTTMKILSLMQQHALARASGTLEPRARTGIFTSAILATGHGHHIALFFTGHHHAGENLAKVLARRAGELAPPIQMCDGLSRNLPDPFETLLANCIAHARRKFVDVTPSFPSECRYVLETLRELYRYEARARKRNLSAAQRLELHQHHSAPLMDALQVWLTEQIEQRKVEPNSGLGEAITYMLKRWDKLTLFLRVPGAPLDNNLCEQALKKAILHRKNALFYKTENGARVGDLYMSLIYSAELAGVSPFDYLTELQRHPSELRAAPAAWMPWSYRATLDATTAAPPARAPP